ncbi:MAG TPA: hypothetical protein VFK06_03075 [Candidatus Angelobacter sp.]|nr:hypothetical protein [Candidatus Angelobacter sp.]
MMTCKSRHISVLLLPKKCLLILSASALSCASSSEEEQAARVFDNTKQAFGRWLLALVERISDENGIYWLGGRWAAQGPRLGRSALTPLFSMKVRKTGEGGYPMAYGGTDRAHT